MEKVLEKVGLNKREIKVYLALLKLGTTTSKAIIEKTSFHRQIVYDVLETLIEKGLVSFVIESNRKHFKASDPNQFINFFNKKQQEIENQKKEFKNIVPELEKLRNKVSEIQEATVFRGVKGIKTLLNDMLNSKEVFTIGSSDLEAEAFKYHLEFNIPQFHKIREQKKIFFKVLLSEEWKPRVRELNKMKYTESKALPKEFTSNFSINIYENKVSMILWGSQPFGILVKSQEISDAQRKYFNILWKIGKK